MIIFIIQSISYSAIIISMSLLLSLVTYCSCQSMSGKHYTSEQNTACLPLRCLKRGEQDDSLRMSPHEREWVTEVGQNTVFLLFNKLRTLQHDFVEWLSKKLEINDLEVY